MSDGIGRLVGGIGALVRRLVGGIDGFGRDMIFCGLPQFPFSASSR